MIGCVCGVCLRLFVDRCVDNIHSLLFYIFIYVFIHFALPQERVIGFHVLGPNAGEMTQGYAVAMRKGATKEDFDATIGIHPTCSEVQKSLTHSTVGVPA